MERKGKVTQAAVNQACEQLQEAGKNVTVNGVINIAGGSFSTVGAMVKAWKEEQAAQSAPMPEMPEAITKVMHKAASDIWEAASGLAGETVERIQHEAKDAIDKAKGELSEYVGEVSRLESALEQAQQFSHEESTRLVESTAQLSALTAESAALKTRLDDRTSELERLRADYDKLQKELIDIAKGKTVKGK